MSSYVIDKKDLKAAAGFLAALAEYKMSGSRYLLWYYDYEQGKPANKVTFASQAEKLHIWNALSVQKQYRDKEPFIDTDLYLSELESAYKDTKQMILDWSWGRGDELKKACFRLHSFIHSVLYQIESEAEEEAAKQILFRWSDALLEVLRKIMYLDEACTSWGHFSTRESED